jgi:hypothetical protein
VEARGNCRFLDVSGRIAGLPIGQHITEIFGGRLTQRNRCQSQAESD